MIPFYKIDIIRYNLPTDVTLCSIAENGSGGYHIAGTVSNQETRERYYVAEVVEGHVKGKLCKLEPVTVGNKIAIVRDSKDAVYFARELGDEIVITKVNKQGSRRWCKTLFSAGEGLSLLSMAVDEEDKLVLGVMTLTDIVVHVVLAIHPDGSGLAFSRQGHQTVTNLNDDYAYSRTGKQAQVTQQAKPSHVSWHCELVFNVTRVQPKNPLIGIKDLT